MPTAAVLQPCTHDHGMRSIPSDQPCTPCPAATGEFEGKKLGYGYKVRRVCMKAADCCISVLDCRNSELIVNKLLCQCLVWLRTEQGLAVSLPSQISSACIVDIHARVTAITRLLVSLSDHCTVHPCAGLHLPSNYQGVSATLACLGTACNCRAHAMIM